jgi:hypothetical protein
MTYVSGRAGDQRASRVPDARGVGVRLLRVAGPAGPAEDAEADLVGRRDRRVHRPRGGIDGALRVTAELRYGRNIVVGHNAVESIMRELSDQGPADPAATEGRGWRRSSRLTLGAIDRPPTTCPRERVSTTHR